MSIDGKIQLGIEGSYADKATAPTRAYEGKADAWQNKRERIVSEGFRAGAHAQRESRVVQYNDGVEGTLEIDVLNKGMGQLLGALLGTKSGPTQIDATTAYRSTFTSSADAPADSFVVQVVRPYVATGTDQCFTFHGVKATSWSLSQSTGGLTTLNVSFDGQDADTTTAEAAATYPADSYPFDWTGACVTLDPEGTPEVLDITDFSFDADLGLKTDRHYLRCNPLKKEQIRTNLASYSGSLTADFGSLDRYNEWLARDTVDMEFKVEGETIEGSEKFALSIRCRAVNWTDGNPVMSLSDVTTQTLPFEVLWDGTNPAVEMTYVSTDTSF